MKNVYSVLASNVDNGGEIVSVNVYQVKVD